MEEIKVGEWIRFKNGALSKNNSNCAWDKNTTSYDGSPVVKHSSNIIDLIEVGDYVNGYKVELSRYDELYTAYVYCGGIGVRTTEAYATFLKDMKSEDIESIVTKEQFTNIEYKIG